MTQSLDDTPHLSVRLAGPSDAAVVAGLLHSFNAEFETPTTTVAEFTERFEVMLWRDDVRVWLAEAPGEGAVGFTFVTLHPSPYYAGKIAQVEELYATPAHRDAGVAAALIASLLAFVERHTVGEVRRSVEAIDMVGPFLGPSQPSLVRRGRIEA